MQAIGRTKLKTSPVFLIILRSIYPFTLKNMVFPNSMQFMNSSLEKLAKNLEDYSYVNQNFITLSNLATQKGINPYDYLDRFETLNETYC